MRPSLASCVRPRIGDEVGFKRCEQGIPAVLAALDAIARGDDTHLFGVGQPGSAVSLGKYDCRQRHGVNPAAQRHGIGEHDASPVLDLEVARFVGVLPHAILKSARFCAAGTKIHLLQAVAEPRALLVQVRPAGPDVVEAVGIGPFDGEGVSACSDTVVI